MNILLTKVIEVPPTDLGSQIKILNLWIADMQRNGINIISNNPHPTIPNAFFIEYRSQDNEPVEGLEGLEPETEVMI